MENRLLFLVALAIGVSSPFVAAFLDEWMEGSEMRRSVVELIVALVVPFTLGTVYFTYTGHNPEQLGFPKEGVLSGFGFAGWLLLGVTRSIHHTFTRGGVTVTHSSSSSSE